MTLIFIGLESPELSGARVSARVKAGGHDVPTDKIHSRFSRTLKNLGRAMESLPRVILFDNSHAEHPHRFVAEFRGTLHRRGEAPVSAWARKFLKRR